MKRERSILRGACLAITLVGLLNMGAFVVISWRMGGDALNGQAVGGHYYLWGYQPKTGHKEYTEVSESTFRYSKWLGCSFLFTFGLMVVANLVLKWDDECN
jgi:hypothetical protein